MPVNKEAYQSIKSYCDAHKVTLVAVSKTKPASEIRELYDLGHRDFGENYVQEMADKQAQLPADIRWHFIGHLQTNKVKYIAPFVHLIHGADSLKILKEIDKQGAKQNRIIQVLLQMHIAREETKFGLDSQELQTILEAPELPALKHISICGLMGMASFSDDMNLVSAEFRQLRRVFDNFSGSSTANCHLQILSMGMSADYEVAIAEGSNMVRIGSLLFGARACALGVG